MNKRVELFFVAAFTLASAACGGEGESSGAGDGANTLRAGGRTAELSKLTDWTMSGPAGVHSRELWTEGARAVVFLEHRLSASEALHRLEQIESEESAPTSHFTFAGQRFIVRVRRAFSQAPGLAERAPQEEATIVTLATAKDDVVLRAEATLHGRPEAEVIRELRGLLAEARLGVTSSLPAFRPRQDDADVFDARRNSDGELEVPAFEAETGFEERINTGGGVDAEIEVGVSDDGRDIVVVNNSREYTTSNTFGQSFSGTQGLPGGPPANGDPSIAWAQSGSFYYAYIAFPNGTPASGNVTGCSTGIHSSTDGGQNFTFQSHAFLSPAVGATVTFPDQEHIAADRVNASSGGNDQIYSVWRDFTPSSPGPMSTCAGISSGFPTPSIVCSSDSAANWTARVAVSSGDFPRVSVGPDGFVYVVFMSGNNVLLNKFSSCASGLVQQAGMPTTVATGVAPANCGNGGIPGLNRCNDGNDLRSAMVAVDETDPSHVFVAYADNSSAANEDIFIQDSTDGGSTWTRPRVKLSAGVTGHRFMPWVCAADDTAFVSWYDMRAGATGATNDLAEFFGATAVLDGGGALVGNPDFAISQAQDPMCGAGWANTSATRGVANSENCSVQPQQAGTCMGTNTRCDFSDCPGASCTCAMGVACQTGGGSPPKYGDYNGAACTGGRFYAAWASATAAPGDPQPADIDVFVACPPDEDDLTGVFGDNTDPFFDTFPPDIFSNTCNVGPIGQAIAFDACGNGAPTVNNDAPASFDPGTTTVTWTATDTAGNSTSRAQTIEVVDTTLPFISCPADQTAECIDGVATVTFPDPFASDDCALASVACVPPSGSVFDLGDTTVTCTATDTSDNSSDCALNVAVVDTTPPVVTVVGAGELWPPNHKYVEKALAECGIEIDDQCQGLIDLEDANPLVTCITSDEVEEGNGDGNTLADMVIVDATTVRLRSERAGGSDGRVYGIHFEVSDAAGNVTAAVCTVTVPANQGPNGAAIDSGVHFSVGTCN